MKPEHLGRCSEREYRPSFRHELAFIGVQHHPWRHFLGCPAGPLSQLVVEHIPFWIVCKDHRPLPFSQSVNRRSKKGARTVSPSASVTARKYLSASAVNACQRMRPRIIPQKAQHWQERDQSSLSSDREPGHDAGSEVMSGVPCASAHHTPASQAHRNEHRCGGLTAWETPAVRWRGNHARYRTNHNAGVTAADQPCRRRRVEALVGRHHIPTRRSGFQEHRYW